MLYIKIIYFVNSLQLFRIRPAPVLVSIDSFLALNMLSMFYHVAIDFCESTV